MKYLKYLIWLILLSATVWAQPYQPAAIDTPKTNPAFLVGQDSDNSWENVSKTAFQDSIEVDFDGNRTVKRTGLVLVNVGTTTTIQAFLEEYFFPFLNATISLATDSTIFEVGGHYLVDLTATITANDDTSFTNGYIMRVSPSKDTLTNWSTSSTSITNTPTYEPQAKETYTYDAGTERDSIGVTRDGATIVNSTTYTYAVYPQFYGDTTLAFVQGNTIPYNATFTKSVIREPSSVERSYVTPDNEYLYFIYPNGDGLLTALDFNSAGSYYDVTSSWSNFTVTIISNGLTNDYTETFRVYKSDELQKSATETLTFRFTF